MINVRFGPFTLDGRARQLIRESRPVHLSPKAFDLLALLLERRAQALSKAEIHECLWPDTFVSDGNVAVLVAEIRTVLGDRPRDSKYVRTVQRFGYAFSGTAQDVANGEPSGRPPASCWIVWNGSRVALARGKNVLGRDPEADVRIDAVGVSRRHAVIVVDGGDVSIADLSSKNGTFADGKRVTAPLSLTRDAELRLGPVPMRFFRPVDAGSTQTWDMARGPSHDR